VAKESISDDIKNKCLDMLQEFDFIHPTILKTAVSNFIGSKCGPYFEKFMAHVHKQKDFEWILISCLNNGFKNDINDLIFPINYIADEVLSFIFLIVYQNSIHNCNITDHVHMRVRKYINLGFLVYFNYTKHDLEELIKGTHSTIGSDLKEYVSKFIISYRCTDPEINEIYKKLHNIVIYGTFVDTDNVDDLSNVTKNRKKIYKYAAILLTELDQDQRL